MLGEFLLGYRQRAKKLLVQQGVPAAGTTNVPLECVYNMVDLSCHQ